MRSLATVILQHDRPGDSHHDWLIEHPDYSPGTGPLICFRLPLPAARCMLNMSVAAKLIVTRLPDHRRRYLTYRGAVSGGRGRVRRIAAGTALLRLHAADRLDLRLSLCGRRVRVALRRIAINAWSAALLPVS